MPLAQEKQVMTSRSRARKIAIDYPEEKEITAHDMTRAELYLYIFGGAIRGFYIIGCLFLDASIPVTILDMIYSDSYGMGIFAPVSTGTWFLASYLILMVLLVEFVLIYFQLRFGRRKISRLGLEPDAAKK